MIRVPKTLILLLTVLALSGCLQTLKHTPVDGREDVRFVEYIKSDGSVDRSYYQIQASDGQWYEGERNNGVWGLSEMGRIDFGKALSGGGGGGGGGGCGS